MLYRDTFGFCPISCSYASDDFGIYKVAWCNLHAYERLINRVIDPFVYRAERWQRLSVAERAWHERHFDNQENSPVFYVTEDYND